MIKKVLLAFLILGWIGVAALLTVVILLKTNVIRSPPVQVPPLAPPTQFEPVSHILSYYENPKGLFRQIHLWSTYFDKALQLMEFIVVDDGSTHEPIDKLVPQLEGMLKDLPIHLTLYRITKDIGFNNGGAKNVGMHEAHTRVFFLNDMDTLLCPSKVERLLRAAKHLQDNQLVPFYTDHADISDAEHTNIPHGNAFLVTQGTVDRCGVYNEDFSGNYGFEDSEFMHRLKKHGVKLSSRVPGWLIQNVDQDWMEDMERHEDMPTEGGNCALFWKLHEQGFPLPTRPLRVPYEKVAEFVDGSLVQEIVGVPDRIS